MSGNGGNPHSLRDLLGTYEKSGLGAESVIAKPFDPMTLSSQVRNIWEQARGRP